MIVNFTWELLGLHEKKLHILRCLVFFNATWFSNCFRKGALLRNNLLHFVAAGLMFSSRFAHSYEMIIAGRLLVGICAGIFTISFREQQIGIVYHYESIITHVAITQKV